MLMDRNEQRFNFFLIIFFKKTHVGKNEEKPECRHAEEAHLPTLAIRVKSSKVPAASPNNVTST